VIIKERTMLTSPLTRRPSGRLVAAVGAGVLLLGASACGSSTPSNTAATTTQGGYSQGNGQNGAGTQRFPGATGKVAAITGSTAQVQNQTDGQVAVTWTSSTAFTQEVSTTAAAIKVGSCVVVGSAQTSTGSTTTTQPTAVTATTVRITPATGGTCSPGFGGRTGGFGGQGGGPQFSGGGPGGAAGGSGGGGFEGTPPSGFPSGGPNGANGRTFRGFGGGAFGKVTAVTANGFTVSSTRPNRSTGQSTTTTVTVTETGTTTYTTTVKGAASDVKVGVCVRAQGTTDSTGAVTARTVAISQPVNGECTTGFFARGGTGFGAGGQGA
jgi:hypothetical protein